MFLANFQANIDNNLIDVTVFVLNTVSSNDVIASNAVFSNDVIASNAVFSNDVTASNAVFSNTPIKRSENVKIKDKILKLHFPTDLSLKETISALYYVLKISTFYFYSI